MKWKKIIFGIIYVGYIGVVLYLWQTKLKTLVSTAVEFALLLIMPLLLVYIRFYNNDDIILKRIRGVVFSVKSKNHSKNLRLAKNITIHYPQYITFGDNCSVDNGAAFFPLVSCLGKSYPSKIVIGNNVRIGSYNRFASMNCVEIEDDVLFAAFVHITDHSHEFRDIKRPVHEQGVFTKGTVKIGKGSWLGYRCNILSGVTIGEHCVVAAGAVVTKSVPPYSVVAGCPAKVIQKYDFDKEEWVSV